MNSSTQQAGDLARRRTSLLIVEDSPDHWKIMESALRQSAPNLQLTWATTKQTALEYLDNCLKTKQFLPHLILLDLYMPERTQGWQVLQAIKQHVRYQCIPVVVISYSSHAADIQETYLLGGNSFITKPLDFAQWLPCIQSLKTYWCDAVTLPNR